MHGPLDHLILLTLMVILFGLLLRGRRRLYKRYWLVGWILTLWSYALWAAPDWTPLFTTVSNAVRYQLGLVGAVTFLISFLLRYAPLKRIFQVALTLTAIVCAVSAGAGFFATHLPLLRVLVGVTFLATLWGGHILLPAAWKRRRLGLALVALLTVAVGLLSTFYGDGGEPILLLCDLTRAGVLLACGVLFVGEFGFTLSSATAMIGFVSWTALYYFAFLGTIRDWDFSVFHEFFNLPKYFVGVGMIVRLFEDTHNRVEQQAAQYRELYEDFRVLFEAYPHPMWIAEPRTGRFLAANPAALAGYGYTEQEMLALRLADLDYVHPDDEKTPLENEIPLDTRDGRPTRHQRKDGSEFWVELIDRGIPFHGSQARFVMARDITQSMRVNQELLHRAQHDALTGLPNRLLLQQRMEQRLADCVRDGRKLLMLTIDIDYFKLINDTHGHLVGDECLVLVAQRLRSSLREADTIGRTGGEEFVAVVGGLRSLEEAGVVTGHLLGLFQEPFLTSSGCLLALKISIGAAVYPDDAPDVETLREQSDRALYQAKRNGRNRAEFAATLRETQASTRP